MKTYIFLAFLLTQTLMFSQSIIEKGYVVLTNGEKIDCFIKYVDWINTPKYFYYQKESEYIKGTPQSIKEFGVYQKFKYISSTVSIEKSSGRIESLTSKRNPVFNKETLFLKVLVEGDKSLYQYDENNIPTKFFFSLDANKIEQLIKIDYWSNNQKNYIANNNYYKQQILNNLKCGTTISSKKVMYLKFEAKSLSDIFQKYNNCKNPNQLKSNLSNNENVNYVYNHDYDKFNLIIKAGFSSTKANVEDYRESIDLGSDTAPRINLELEYVFPFLNNSLSMFIETSYFKYNFTGLSQRSEFSKVKEVSGDYPVLSFSGGAKYSYRLDKNNKLYALISYGIVKNPNTFIKKDNVNTIRLHNNLNSSYTSLGIGYILKDKYSLELKWDTPRPFTYINSGYTSEISSLSLLLGYTVF